MSSANSTDDDQDWSEVSYEELVQRVHDLQKQNENQAETIARLQKQITELQANHTEHPAPTIINEIEWLTRTKDPTEHRANTRRATEIWSELPRYAEGHRNNLTLKPTTLKQAIASVDDRAPHTVKSETVKRVRTRLSELGEAAVTLKERRGTGGQTREIVVVTVNDWGWQRPAPVVRELLPPKIAESVLEVDE